MKNIVVIDGDSVFIEALEQKLKEKNLTNKYNVIKIVPQKKSSDIIVQYTIDIVLKEIKKLKNIACFLVDIHILPSGTSFDISGIKIATALKKLFKKIPVYNITGKVHFEEQLNTFSEATFEDLDGVFWKGYLDGRFFEEAKLNKILHGKKRINYKKQNNNENELENITQNDSSNGVDIGIITALYEYEFENLKKVFKLKKDAKTKYHFGKMQSKNRSINIVAFHQPETGMIDTAIAATEMIVKYSPKFIIMTGVCGGIKKDKNKPGDIVVANKLFLYQKGKESDDGFQRELESCSIDSQILAEIKEHKVTIIDKIIKYQASRSPLYQEKKVNVLFEPMACGTLVIDKKDYAKIHIEEIDRKAIAVDMESFSIARACKIINRGTTKAIIIKSIMDFTAKKNDKYKSYASFTSSLFCKFLIEDVLFK